MSEKQTYEAQMSPVDVALAYEKFGAIHHKKISDADLADFNKAYAFLAAFAEPDGTAFRVTGTACSILAAEVRKLRKIITLPNFQAADSDLETAAATLQTIANMVDDEHVIEMAGKAIDLLQPARRIIHSGLRIASEQLGAPAKGLTP